MDSFTILLDVVIVLGAALTFGLLLARLGQSPVVGYLLAGVLIGPFGLGLLKAVGEVQAMAELGVALLLFTIGLELPWERLKALGLGVVAAGVLQIGATAGLTMALARAIGLSPREGLVLGMIVALSSTAVVFRVLADRAELDSAPGRVSVGILIVQDVAVIPFVLLIPAVAGTGGDDSAWLQLGVTLLRGGLLILVLLVLARTLMPLLLGFAAAARSRELFVILALTFSLGATWLAHSAHVSPVLGAFVAGVFLADSKFASQIRAEIAPFRSGFLALFFVSVGMLADPGWTAANAPLVLGAVAGILIGKAAITSLVVRVSGQAWSIATVAGLTLAQIGELSFVVLEVARGEGLVGGGLFRLVVSVSVITLLLTPYLVASARPIGVRLGGRRRAVPREGEPGGAEGPHSGHVIIVGCGPTGLRVVQALEDVGTPYLVLELNPASVRTAAGRGMPIEFGDASQEEILAHAGIGAARALVVTVPDPATAEAIVATARELRQDLPIVARARYARSAPRLLAAGADVLLNEEQLMGERLAAVTLRLLGVASEGVARVESERVESERVESGRRDGAA